MQQTSLATTGFELAAKRTRKRAFLAEMDQVIPWSDLLALIAPHAPAGRTGRPPFAIEVMLRIHLLQQFFGHSDPAMEEALHDIPLYREFAHLDAGITRLPDESTILRFRHLLEQHDLGQQILALVNAQLTERGLMLKQGTVIDATLISAPSSTKNHSGERDPEMHQTKKGNQWHFGMKTHIGVDADSGLVHTVTTTAANAHDITQAHALLHGQEEVVFADSGYRGVHKREEVQAQHPDVDWQIAMMPGQRKAMDQSQPVNALKEQLEQIKASIRAKVEHPFRVIKCQFGHRKVRYRGLAKNTSQLLVMFALSNLWMVRKRILQALQA
ncbi:IS5 family transposase [Ottowia sp.]|uniref:IS5 family transposase n=1 Tax=Ottowia sp. TaxID=1898956 RepID=UPI003A86E2E9